MHDSNIFDQGELYTIISNKEALVKKESFV